MPDLEWYKPQCACSREARGVRLVAYVIASGDRRYGLRCETCGRINGSRPISAQLFSSQEREAADAQNLEQSQEAIRQSTETLWHEQQARRDQQNEAKEAEWWSRYEEYMLLGEWLAKREAVIRRDGYICQACLRARASQAHHLTYDHLFDEPLFDLVAVCLGCHEHITQQDRARRIQRRVTP